MAYMPPPALLHQSWPRLKHSPIAFAVASPYHAVTVFVGIHLGNAFARLVGDRDHAAVIDRRLRHQRFAVGLIGRDRAFVARCRRPLHQHFAVGLIGRDVPLPSIVAVNWKACLVSTRYPRFMQQSLSQPRRLYK